MVRQRVSSPGLCGRSHPPALKHAAIRRLTDSDIATARTHLPSHASAAPPRARWSRPPPDAARPPERASTATSCATPDSRRPGPRRARGADVRRPSGRRGGRWAAIVRFPGNRLEFPRDEDAGDVPVINSDTMFSTPCSRWAPFAPTCHHCHAEATGARTDAQLVPPRAWDWGSGIAQTQCCAACSHGHSKLLPNASIGLSKTVKDPARGRNGRKPSWGCGAARCALAWWRWCSVGGSYGSEAPPRHCIMS